MFGGIRLFIFKEYAIYRHNAHKQIVRQHELLFRKCDKQVDASL